MASSTSVLWQCRVSTCLRTLCSTWHHPLLCFGSALFPPAHTSCVAHGILLFCALAVHDDLTPKYCAAHDIIQFNAFGVSSVCLLAYTLQHRASSTEVPSQCPVFTCLHTLCSTWIIDLCALAASCFCLPAFAEHTSLSMRFKHSPSNTVRCTGCLHSCPSSCKSHTLIFFYFDCRVQVFFSYCFFKGLDGLVRLE